MKKKILDKPLSNHSSTQRVYKSGSVKKLNNKIITRNKINGKITLLGKEIGTKNIATSTKQSKDACKNYSVLYKVTIKREIKEK